MTSATSANATPTEGGTAGNGRQPRGARLVARLAIELAIGIGIAAVLVVVAWASSNAIRFVYGGY
jgi:hypothetical protein